MNDKITGYWNKQGRIWCSFVVVLMAMVIFSGSAMAQAEKKEEKSPNDLRVYWSNGLRFETADKNFTFNLGGRIMSDWAFVEADDALEANLGEELVGGTEFRRARFYLSGKVHKNVEFKLQMDFGGGEVKFKDAYVGVTKLPGIGGFRVGHFKEPFGLEELTSSKYITFMERALPSLFWPSRNNGFMVHNRAADERMSWAVGVFKDVGDEAEVENDDRWNLTGRVTGLPVYNDGGRQLLHLGGSFSYRSHDGRSIRYRQRPEVHLSPRFVNTGNFTVDSVVHTDYEVALVQGPFSAQMEYTRVYNNTPSVNDPSLWGFYVQGSVFLTGENRAYKKSSGAFDRVKPKKNIGSDGGAGAWELAARYSQLNLNDQGITGGELRDFTLGLNWHLNPVTRFMFNYVYADKDKIGKANHFMMRFQIDF